MWPLASRLCHFRHEPSRLQLQRHGCVSARLICLHLGFRNSCSGWKSRSESWTRMPVPSVGLVSVLEQRWQSSQHSDQTRGDTGDVCDRRAHGRWKRIQTSCGVCVKGCVILIQRDDSLWCICLSLTLELWDVERKQSVRLLLSHPTVVRALSWKHHLLSR